MTSQRYTLSKSAADCRTLGCTPDTADRYIQYIYSKGIIYMNMKTWASSPITKPMPVLSFPSVQLLNVTVRELISDSTLQARGMKAVADRVDSAASVSLMDLSVEAEAFGAPVRFSDDEVPTCAGPLIDPDLDEDEHEEAAENLKVPEIGAGRTGIYIEGIRKAKELITDRPVFAGLIGPFSLAGRLVDVTNSMVFCLTEPDYMHAVLEKTTRFIKAYAAAFKAAGADGVVMAEPLAGLLSPKLAGEFSGDYCREIVSELQDDDFIFVYHNCGNTASVTIDSILSAGAAMYHFGNAVDMADILEKMPGDVPCLGNVDPARQFRAGTPESVRTAAIELLDKCGSHKNFIPSSGCDIPPLSPWENIDAFFAACAEWRNR